MELLETAFIRGQWLIFQVCPMYDTIKPQIPECGFGAQLPPSVGQANPGERPRRRPRRFPSVDDLDSGPTAHLFSPPKSHRSFLRAVQRHKIPQLQLPLQHPVEGEPSLTSLILFPTDREATRVPAVHLVPHPWILAKGRQELLRKNHLISMCSLLRYLSADKSSRDSRGVAVPNCQTH